MNEYWQGVRKICEEPHITELGQAVIWHQTFLDGKEGCAILSHKLAYYISTKLKSDIQFESVFRKGPTDKFQVDENYPGGIKGKDWLTYGG